MTLRVLPLQHTTDRYDWFIAAVGYETRCLHIAKNVNAAKKYFAVYEGQDSGVFKGNLDRAHAFADAELVSAGDLPSFRDGISRLLSRIGNGETLGIDISSFDRRRLAILLDEVSSRGQALSELTVDVLYSPAAYSPPPEHLGNNPLEAGPIGTRFHGHLRRTSLPLAAVFGLGYEPQRAIGGFELLEPSLAWAFWPNSDDDQYEASLQVANRLLLSVFSPPNILTYPVLNPGETYYRLESLVHGISRDNRVVLVPMGPKILAACCILLGLSTAPERPAVWRIGETGSATPFDAKPRGEVVGLRLEIGTGVS